LYAVFRNKIDIEIPNFRGDLEDAIARAPNRTQWDAIAADYERKLIGAIGSEINLKRLSDLTGIPEKRLAANIGAKFAKIPEEKWDLAIAYLQSPSSAVFELRDPHHPTTGVECKQLGDFSKKLVADFSGGFHLGSGGEEWEMHSLRIMEKLPEGEKNKEGFEYRMLNLDDQAKGVAEVLAVNKDMNLSIHFDGTKNAANIVETLTDGSRIDSRKAYTGTILEVVTDPEITQLDASYEEHVAMREKFNNDLIIAIVNFKGDNFNISQWLEGKGFTFHEHWAERKLCMFTDDHLKMELLRSFPSLFSAPPLHLVKKFPTFFESVTKAKKKPGGLRSNILASSYHSKEHKLKDKYLDKSLYPLLFVSSDGKKRGVVPFSAGKEISYLGREGHSYSDYNQINFRCMHGRVLKDTPREVGLEKILLLNTRNWKGSFNVRNLERSCILRIARQEAARLANEVCGHDDSSFGHAQKDRLGGYLFQVLYMSITQFHDDNILSSKFKERIDKSAEEIEQEILVHMDNKELESAFLDKASLIQYFQDIRDEVAKDEKNTRERKEEFAKLQSITPEAIEKKWTISRYSIMAGGAKNAYSILPKTSLSDMYWNTLNDQDRALLSQMKTPLEKIFQGLGLDISGQMYTDSRDRTLFIDHAVNLGGNAAELKKRTQVTGTDFITMAVGGGSMGNKRDPDPGLVTAVHEAPINAKQRYS